VVAPFDGKQAEWMKETLSKHSHFPYKFVAYHFPIYPSRRPENHPFSKWGRDAWTPLFDKYNVKIAFEHNEHCFKRSKPLKGNKVDKTGTLYLGDGSFGVPVQSIFDLRWYEEKVQEIQHFFYVTIQNNAIHANAIDNNGDTFDSVTVI